MVGLDPRSVTRRSRITPGGGALPVTIGVLLAITACGGITTGRTGGPVVPTPAPSAALPASATPPPTAASEPPPTSSRSTRPPAGLPVSPTREVPASKVLQPGGQGPAVLALQRRLVELGYWLGTPDGRYGNLTTQAVLALQKVAGLTRDGVAGPQTQAALAAGLRPALRSPAGLVIEINKSRQVLVIARNGRVMWTFNTSTGSGSTYSYGGHTNLAVTPTGRFTIFRQVDGEDVSPLGRLWRPKYFNGGIAIHGYNDVPGYPASHGCVRVSDPAIDYLWASGLAAIGTAVLVY